MNTQYPSSASIFLLLLVSSWIANTSKRWHTYYFFRSDIVPPSKPQKSFVSPFSLVTICFYILFSFATKSSKTFTQFLVIPCEESNSTGHELKSTAALVGNKAAGSGGSHGPYRSPRRRGWRGAAGGGRVKIPLDVHHGWVDHLHFSAHLKTVWVDDKQMLLTCVFN